MHIYDFISDEFQYELKEKARQRPHRLAFEKSLEIYIQLFQEELKPDKITSTGDSKYLHPALRARPEVTKWLDEYKRLFLQEAGDIKDILKETLEIYKVFIRGKQHNAVLRFHDLLDRFNLLDKVDWELLGGFFRCRWYDDDEKSEIEKKEFFHHIPYNKRYLIANQRFSVSGIPLLYLGSSLATSCYEIGHEDLNTVEKQNLAISFWGFNPAFQRYAGADYITQPRINVFDISNLAYDILNDVIMDVVLEKDDIVRDNIISNYTFVNRDNVRIAIRKFALIQVCTFVTDKFKSASSASFPDGKLLNNFYEEYILPQLLTEAIRLHKYDGIIYPSTKFHNKKIASTTGWISGAFNTNLAMFSHYSVHGLYDDPLIQNFVVDPQKKNLQNLIELRNKINERLNDIEFHQMFITWYTNNSFFSQRVRAMMRYCRKRLRLYQVLLIDGQIYGETNAGNIELQFIIDYIEFILRELRYAYHEEFEKYDQDVLLGKYTFSWMKNKSNDNVGTLY